MRFKMINYDQSEICAFSNKLLVILLTTWNSLLFNKNFHNFAFSFNGIFRSCEYNLECMSYLKRHESIRLKKHFQKHRGGRWAGNTREFFPGYWDKMPIIEAAEFNHTKLASPLWIYQLFLFPGFIKLVPLSIGRYSPWLKMLSKVPHISR